MFDLSTLSLSKLTAAFNYVADGVVVKKVNKFATKTDALRRLTALLASSDLDVDAKGNVVPLSTEPESEVRDDEVDPREDAEDAKPHGSRTVSAARASLPLAAALVAPSASAARPVDASALDTMVREQLTEDEHQVLVWLRASSGSVHADHQVARTLETKQWVRTGMRNSDAVVVRWASRAAQEAAARLPATYPAAPPATAASGPAAAPAAAPAAGRAARIREADLLVVTGPNPHREGGKFHARWALYRDGAPVATFVDACVAREGGTRARWLEHVSWERRHGRVGVRQA